MSEPYQLADVSFLEHIAGKMSVRRHVEALADAKPYILDRFIFHWHLYSTAQRMPERQLIGHYIEYLGYNSSGAEQLHELEISSAFKVLERMCRRDLARDEEVIWAGDAHQMIQCIRDEVSSWASLAFANQYVPEGQEDSFNGYSFVRVVARKDVEGGVFLLGDQDIAMIWFVDDDGPTRAGYGRGGSG